jgi:hypothetical protein
MAGKELASLREGRQVAGAGGPLKNGELQRFSFWDNMHEGSIPPFDRA